MIRRTGRELPGFMLACLLALPAHAVDAADADKTGWNAWARAFYATSNSAVQFDSQTLGVSGSLVDFEDDLGVDERKALPMLGVQWRFADRHEVGLAYFELRRSGRRIIEAEIRWDDVVFPVSADLSSFFDTKVARVAYRYALAAGDRTEFWIGGGLHITEMSAGLSETTIGGSSVSSSNPLPMLTGAFTYGIAPEWTVSVLGEWFGIEIDDLSGQLWHADLALNWQTWQNVGLSLGYNYFTLDFGLGDADFRGLFDYSYQGPFLGLNVSF